MIALQIISGWLYGHFAEYFIHKNILHNNKRFKKMFKRHFGKHHRISRQNEMYDKNYQRILHGDSLFELGGLLLLLLVHLPIVYIAPYFWFTLLFTGLSYYILHRTSHIYVAWGKKWLPWHYEHHMGKNQHKNWGVRLPIIDWLFSRKFSLIKDN